LQNLSIEQRRLGLLDRYKSLINFEPVYFALLEPATRDLKMPWRRGAWSATPDLEGDAGALVPGIFEV
jgi:hypothetical protein